MLWWIEKHKNYCLRYLPKIRAYRDVKLNFITSNE